MRPVKTIILSTDQGDKEIIFGIPDTAKELEAMYELRYEVYVKEKKYIPFEEYKSSQDIDYHDRNNECTYFIASLENEVIGTGRIIQSIPLPIFKDYFHFAEPRGLRGHDDSKKVEIGRIISRHRHIANIDIPRHLIVLGIFSSMADHVASIGVVGGYGAMKQSAVVKYERIGFPIHRIKRFTQIFVPSGTEDPLKNFFDEKDPPIPVYYLQKHVQDYGSAFFNHTVLFEKVGEQQYRFKNPPMTLSTKLSLLLMRIRLHIQFLWELPL